MIAIGAAITRAATNMEGGGSMATTVRSLKIPLIAATTTTPGAVCAVANPEGVDLLVLSAQFITITPDDDGLIDFGIANDATTSASNIFNDADATVTQAASAGLDANQVCVQWGASQFLTGTASASLAGLEAVLYVQYIRA